MQNWLLYGRVLLCHFLMCLTQTYVHTNIIGSFFCNCFANAKNKLVSDIGKFRIGKNGGLVIVKKIKQVPPDAVLRKIVGFCRFVEKF